MFNARRREVIEYINVFISNLITKLFTCSAREDFITCVTNAGRSCSTAAGTLLRRMAWVLAQDVAACNQQLRAYCSAPPPPLTAPLLTAIYGVIFYPLRL